VVVFSSAASIRPPPGATHPLGKYDPSYDCKGSDLLSTEREKGFEPSTLALARRCSTTELFPQDVASLLPTASPGGQAHVATSGLGGAPAAPAGEVLQEGPEVDPGAPEAEEHAQVRQHLAHGVEVHGPAPDPQVDLVRVVHAESDDPHQLQRRLPLSFLARG